MINIQGGYIGVGEHDVYFQAELRSRQAAQSWTALRNNHLTSNIEQAINSIISFFQIVFKLPYNPRNIYIYISFIYEF